ncbi:cellulase family glycosylhydrolase [Proteiniphilum sp.]|uniref:cellulase family glycosylhydrolase n=1 Tax=Proteiniphilum sp. TaxID=1926877 RepID=UPI002B1EF07D|nr:cellulase family glycosylhydrolase [Proteiniphilum sp.]MEA4916463.1 cellulase family glycosylhydrolase [Proteiniphilum sp.]
MKKIYTFLLPVLLFALLNCANANPKESDNNDSDKEPSWGTAAEINKRLGKGMNIGNTFEAMSSWQSPFDPEDFKRIASLGFNHVRIPIRWEREDRSNPSTPYSIHPEFMETIRSVVDEALKNKLHIVINMHHHDALYADPAGQKARFLSQWQQIADYFKEYPDSLLFEIMNEPHDNLTADLWNDYSKEALQVIRKSNSKRCVLLGVAEWGGVSALQKLDIPNDPNLILTIHYYNPFHFTHQAAEWVEGSEAWLGTGWHDTESERKAIQEDFKIAKKIAREKNIPIHIGEFGAFSRADMESRIRWTQYLARWFEQQGFSWAYWEWNGSFGIFDPKTSTYHTELADALLKSPIPKPLTPAYTTIYSSNFSKGNDGWHLYNNDTSASSSTAISDNRIKLTITKPGKAQWHIQLIKDGINVEQGKTYLIRFHISSPGSDEKNIGLNISKSSDPWTSYAEKAFTIDKEDTEYELMFTATQSDARARIVFSIGDNGTTDMILHTIQWMEVEF